MLSITQRYKMKAIHNNGNVHSKVIVNVVNNAKIQNESNSQLHCKKVFFFGNVVNNAKIQNESNSQRGFLRK